ncbi:unnamed protein product [Effrenium voratum]|nr:unnamed protein product [Effrenium voratum]
MARLALLAAVVGASATCELPALRFKGGELGAVRGLKDSSACRATCVQTLGCLRFTFTWKDPRLEERRLASALPLPPKRPAQDGGHGVPSNCQLFDSSSHKEPAEEEAVSGLVTCNPSAQREPLGSSRDLFKEVTREPEVAPKDAFFLQEGARPTNTWWSNVFINGQPGQASNFLTQMPGPQPKPRVRERKR